VQTGRSLPAFQSNEMPPLQSRKANESRRSVIYFTRGVQVLRSPIFFSGLGADGQMLFSLKYVCTLCECVTEMAALYGTQNSSGGGESEECF
jgi:hypothetical protein